MSSVKNRSQQPRLPPFLLEWEMRSGVRWCQPFRPILLILFKIQTSSSQSNISTEFTKSNIKMKMQYYDAVSQVIDSQTHLSDQLYKFFETLDNTSGFLFFQTLGVFILTLAISEALCLFLLVQTISRITWYSFYDDFPLFRFFMMDMTAPEEAEGVMEEMPTMEQEELDKVLITTSWSCSSNLHCLTCNEEGGELKTRRCAICLCDYGELNKECF